MRRVILIMLLLTSASVQAASYSVAGQCYGDSDSALAAFQSQFPQISNLAILNLTDASISQFGVIAFTTQQRFLTSASWTINPSSTVQLPECTSGFVATGRLEHFLSVVLLVVLFLFGFTVGKGMIEDRQYGDRA